MGNIKSNSTSEDVAAAVIEDMGDVFESYGRHIIKGNIDGKKLFYLDELTNSLLEKWGVHSVSHQRRLVERFEETIGAFEGEYTNQATLVTMVPTHCPRWLIGR